MIRLSAAKETTESALMKTADWNSALVALSDWCTIDLAASDRRDAAASDDSVAAVPDRDVRQPRVPRW